MNLAIVDADVVGELFSGNSHDAGPEFLKWIERGDGHLSAGGENWKELREHNEFKAWAVVARNSGWLRLVPEDAVQVETENLERDKARGLEGACKSNDSHVIALARVGGARLLYTNDSDLQRDFVRSDLIDNPRGKVYTTRLNPRFRQNKGFTNTHRALLRQKDLMGAPIGGA